MVNNTHEQQAEKPLVVKVCIDGQACPESGSQGFQNLPGDATNGVQRKPMAVTEIVFSTRQVYQSNPLPCAVNEITVLLATSVPLHLACGDLNLTISGIVNTQTNDNENMVVTDCTSSLASPLFSSVGVWQKSLGILKVALLQDTVQNKEYCLRFTVKNPSVGTVVASDVTADIATILPATGTSFANSILTETSPSHSRILVDTTSTWGDFLCADRQNDFLKVGTVASSSFAVKTVSQSNPFP